MARQLSEQPFMLVVGNICESYKELPYYGILSSYVEIMKAKCIYMKEETFPNIPEEIGTVVYIATEENIRNVLPTIPSNVRLIGYVNCTEGIITSPNCCTYLGMPVSQKYMQDIHYIPGMREVVYPHITLEQLPDTSDYTMVGRTIRFKLEETILQTPNTTLNRAWIQNEVYHVTRQVADGKHPSCAGKELKELKLNNPSSAYAELQGYPVLM